jgi:hypothetical protein
MQRPCLVTCYVDDSLCSRHEARCTVVGSSSRSTAMPGFMMLLPPRPSYASECYFVTPKGNSWLNRQYESQDEEHGREPGLREADRRCAQ